MSLGSRIAKRGKAAIIASLVSTPREPLLFLYPQWVRNSSTTSPAASAKLSRDASYLNATAHKALSSSKTSSSLPVLNGPSEQRSTIAQSQHSNSPTTGARDISETLSGEIVLPRKTPIDFQSPSSNLASIERRVNQILSAEKKRQNAEHTARRERAEFQDLRREGKQAWLADWRKILGDLIKNTPRHGEWLDQAVQVDVSPSAAALLITGIDSYIWDIGIKHECSVALGPRSEVLGCSSFILSGSKTSLSRTLADILRIVPDAIVRTTEKLYPLRPECPPSTPELLVTHRAKPRWFSWTPQNKVHRVTPHDIPRPTKWTPATFFDYVKALTTVELPHNMRGKTQHYYDAISDILRNLFRDPDPACKTAITREACHEALRYWVRTNRIDDVRVLFVRMELLKLQLTPETFNIMLEGAAKQEDLDNFHFILHLMLRRGLMPNGGTWNAFLMALPNYHTKCIVVDAMKRQGLLFHKSMMKAVCVQLIEPEVKMSIDRGEDQDTFIAHMDSRYGRLWLKLDSGNRVLHELGSRGLISRCWDWLHFMVSRFIQPDHYSINTILHHCKEHANLAGAVELMQNIPPHWGLIPNAETYRILFELAWRWRSYNIAKVVWKYACLSGNTTNSMRRRVLKSLKAPLKEAWPDTPKRRWNWHAGSVMLSNSGRQHRFIITEPSHGQVKRSGIPTKYERSPRYFSPPQKLISCSSSGTVERDTVKEKLTKKTTEGKSKEKDESSKAKPKAKTKADMKEKLDEQAKKGIIVPSVPTLYRPFKYDDAAKIPPDVFKARLELIEQEFGHELAISKPNSPVEPVLPFGAMLGQALEHDTEWRKGGQYRDERLPGLIQGAVRVPVRRRGKGHLSVKYA